MKSDPLVEAWLTYQKNWWAFEALDKLITEKPAEALKTIENIAHRTNGDIPLLGALAAGPLEDLLARHGETIIGDVEAVAKRDPAIRRCLAGVWKNKMSHDLYARVQNAAEPGFRFP